LPQRKIARVGHSYVEHSYVEHSCKVVGVLWKSTKFGARIARKLLLSERCESCACSRQIAEILRAESALRMKMQLFTLI